ncbi:hypothetical protein SLEP1_g46360 [Rubroshorea leprosula]|uniref:Uncharacterized protein n=1 Tax=Rubroshorea leprosula TaxID=152421 RepID=A0AAV5LML0_9ROSI|nr:hypothetical protein SLEP1_g46360 [Rubroshorea leprosula]
MCRVSRPEMVDKENEQKIRTAQGQFKAGNSKIQGNNQLIKSKLMEAIILPEFLASRTRSGGMAGAGFTKN